MLIDALALINGEHISKYMKVKADVQDDCYTPDSLNAPHDTSYELQVQLL